MSFPISKYPFQHSNKTTIEVEPLVQSEWEHPLSFTKQDHSQPLPDQGQQSNLESFYRFDTSQNSNIAGKIHGFIEDFAAFHKLDIDNKRP